MAVCLCRCGAWGHSSWNSSRRPLRGGSDRGLRGETGLDTEGGNPKEGGAKIE